ncbi:universal stress protein [Desulfosarcina sp.]|uniref:universal stress protein n=1 Tax=Desulfosarcina sp. TaxID=2027861 RepID=UPI0029B2C69A|nr:universal stress protein [Desulfosarcina sp.]MDX2454105.1 universal stress protein [Desulfosarcina sp.]MDX2491787.1 universal stress protein [Desulfosarcina sp.]
MIKDETEFNKNILIAVDESENASRAVSYVGQMLAGVLGFKVIVLHVISQPEEDFFSTAAEKDTWLGQYKLKVDAMLKNYRKRLIGDGIEPQDVSVRSRLRYCPSLTECILAERSQMNCSTIVVGRQGISRSEEFLFGSVSSKIVNHARDCTVWVVE